MKPLISQGKLLIDKQEDKLYYSLPLSRFSLVILHPHPVVYISLQDPASVITAAFPVLAAAVGSLLFAVGCELFCRGSVMTAEIAPGPSKSIFLTGKEIGRANFRKVTVT